MEGVEQRGAGEDEHEPQHERERDAPGEHLRLHGWPGTAKYARITAKTKTLSSDSVRSSR